MSTLCRTASKIDLKRSNRSSIKRQLRFLSTTNNEQVSDLQNERKPLSLYFWGTNQKGSIPTKDVLEEGRKGAISGGLLDRGGVVIDHPVQIDLEDAFGKYKCAIELKVYSCVCVCACRIVIKYSLHGERLYT
jgi:hypothetical protein